MSIISSLFRLARSHLLALLFVAVCAGTSLQAQAKDQFVQGLSDFINAVQGTHGDEGPAVVAAIKTMTDALVQWDAAVGRVEAGLASEIGAAPPAAAARMRATLGTAYLDRGRYEAAVTQFDMALARDPSLAEAHALRGLALEALNRPREAADAYRKAWQQDHAKVAQAYRYLRSSRGQTDSAETAGAVKVLLDAMNGPSRDRLAFATLALLDDTSVADPLFAPARYADAFALLRQGKYDDAVARLHDAVAGDPLVSDASLTSPEMTSAIAALKQGANPQTLSGLVDAARRHNGSPEVRRVLGTAYAAASQPDKALEELRAAVRVSPANERARLALADVLMAQGDSAAARVMLSETAQAIPKSGQAHWKLGRLHQSFGDDANAVRSFEAAARLFPIAGAGRLQASIGQRYHSQLDLAAATAAYIQRIVLTPNDAAAHLDLADVYRADDMQDAALVESLVGVLLDPAQARGYATVGQIRAATGRDEEAVVALRKAVALDPAHLEAHYALSRALARLNRADEAREELQIFERLQAKAMAEERQRFQDNQRKIQGTLDAVDPKGPPR
ncbi:MAG TPA: tetratricopeptide repeat protein [Vicinamibacterales bacterium]|nr:tetratricopeptide repeat protein [Vicinamibacterales bacterium]